MKLAVSPMHKGRAITVCDLCGTRFLSWISKEQRYCSRKCYNYVRHLEAYVARPCELCGLSFDAKRGKNQRFCGYACLAASRRRPVDVTCPQCGATFVARPAQHARYCSRACTNAAARGRQNKGRLDLTGQRYARLVVIAPADKHRGGRIQWLCQCDCGQTTTVTTRGLRSGRTRSCGCLMREESARIGKNHHDARHVTHGWSRTPEYRIWHDMRRRCENPANRSYPHYGGRGIAVCTRWQDFAAFYRDMGPRPGPTFTIERKDVNQGYSKDNCVWIEACYQARNTTRNRLLTFDGRTQTMFEWAREIGISPAGLCTRLNRQGMTVEEALTKPVKPGRSTWTHPLTYHGKTQTLIAWARETGIKSQTLGARIKKGWSIERALETPVGGRD